MGGVGPHAQCGRRPWVTLLKVGFSIEVDLHFGGLSPGKE